MARVSNQQHIGDCVVQWDLHCMFSQYEGMVAYYGHGMSVANEENSGRLLDAIVFHVL